MADKKKSIIICSDGTGNRGGVGPETNVYRIYSAIDIQKNDHPQIRFYDDGVGTGGNKIWKLLGGAFGLGLDRNIIEAYTFLCRNFNEGDDIYLFGFSRGAYTVRALASFIAYCGVLKSIDGVDILNIDDESLRAKINCLAKFYKKRAVNDGKNNNVDQKAKSVETYECKKFFFKKTSIIYSFIKTNIKFIGVWDTVSAVGLPFEIELKKWIAELFFNFHFKDFDLPSKVDSACHALAIDDQRKTFHPILWNDNDDNKIDQVWFSGMHSNVGGGYPKQGMAYVSLVWMISKVKNRAGNDGLFFCNNSVEEFQEKANPLGKMYDSRSGLAAYYRFEPRFFRNMEKLNTVKLHFSVVERIVHQTADYNPGNFVLRNNDDIGGEQKIEVVNAPVKSWGITVADKIKTDIDTISERLCEFSATTISDKQEALHLAFVQFSLLLCIALISGYIALNTDITAWIKDYAVIIFSFFYILIMVLTHYYSKNWRKKRLCEFTSLLLPVFLFFPETEIFENSVRMLESLLGVVPLIDAIIETILGIVSCVVGIFLPDFLMNPIDYFIENNTAITSIAILIFVILMVKRNKLSKKAKKIAFDAWKDLREKDVGLNDSNPLSD